MTEDQVNEINSKCGPYPFILLSEGITRTDFINQFGTDYLMKDPATASSEEIAHVILNKEIFKKGFLKTGDKLSVEVFDNASFITTIEDITSVGRTFSMRGSMKKPARGMFMLAITDNQVLASMRFEQTDTFYMVKYNNYDQKHYIYKTSYHLINFFDE